MSKVLQPGKNRPVIFKCKNCGCVFEANSNEYCIHRGLFRVEVWKTCPHCYELVTMYIKRKQCEECK